MDYKKITEQDSSYNDIEKKSVNQIRWGRRVRHPNAMMLIKVADVINKINKKLFSV